MIRALTILAAVAAVAVSAAPVASAGPSKAKAPRFERAEGATAFVWLAELSPVGSRLRTQHRRPLDAPRVGWGWSEIRAPWRGEGSAADERLGRDVEHGDAERLVQAAEDRILNADMEI